MKKAAVLLLCFCLIFGLSACGNNNLYQAPTKEATQAETQPEEGAEGGEAASGGEEVPEATEAPAAPEEPAYEVQDVAAHTMYVNAESQLNVRRGPSTDTESVYALNRGDAVTVTGVSGDWSRIDMNGESYFVKTEFLSDSQPTAQASVDSVSTGHIVCIDPGHQQSGISELEPNGPGSSVMKAKLATGTTGVATGRNESELTLEVSLKLRDELQARGYQVIMIRETQDCPSSNAERAVTANESGAEIFVRIHANGSDDPSVNGAVCFAPSTSNPYVGSIAEQCQNLSRLVVNSLCEATGAKNLDIQLTDDMTGINWCQIPVTIVEMGFMTNPTEDQNMSDPTYQQKMVEGIANGIDAYFA